MHRGEGSQGQVPGHSFPEAHAGQNTNTQTSASRLHMHVMSSKLVLSGQYNGLIGTRPNAGADGAPHTDVHEQPAMKAVIT